MCHRDLCWARSRCDITHLIPSVTYSAGQPGYSAAPVSGLQFHLLQVSIGMSFGVGRDPIGGSKYETKGSKLKIHLPCSLSSPSIKKQNQKTRSYDSPEVIL